MDKKKKKIIFRQMDEGCIFAVFFLSVGTIGLFCFIIFLIQSPSISLVLPAISVVGCVFFSWKFFSMWNTFFFITDDGIVMFRHNTMVREYKWEQIQKVYIHTPGQIPRKNWIVISSVEIPGPLNRKTVKKLEDHLLWLSYTKQKEKILTELAKGIIQSD